MNSIFLANRFEFQGPTGIGMHGSVRSQLSSQLIPLLKERMLGEKGVKVRSYLDLQDNTQNRVECDVMHGSGRWVKGYLSGRSLSLRLLHDSNPGCQRFTWNH